MEPPPPRLHQGLGTPGACDERVRADVHGHPEPVPRGVREAALEVLGGGEGDRVDEHVEASVERLRGLGEDPVEIVVRADVARRHQLRVHGRGQVPDGLLDPLALIGEGRAGHPRRRVARDRPGDRAPVGDPEHERLLALEPPRHGGDPTPRRYGPVVRAFAHDLFTYPLPDGHRFPLDKYRLVREAAEDSSPSRCTRPRPRAGISCVAHTTRTGSSGSRDGRLARREELALGLPWSPELVERSRRSSGATIMAARAALEDGVAANLGGGTHHAFAHSGRGFCVFNDVVTALRELRASDRVRRALIVDVDVHQGDGTHALLAADADAFTVSVNGWRNYPFRRVPGDVDVDLPDGTGDEEYLAELARVLPAALRRSRPELCFVLAGADPYEGDRLGRLSLTKAGLRERDVLIRDTLEAVGVPICVTLAGGYAEDIHDTVEINVNTLRVFA